MLKRLRLTLRSRLLRSMLPQLRLRPMLMPKRFVRKVRQLPTLNVRRVLLKLKLFVSAVSLKPKLKSSRVLLVQKLLSRMVLPKLKPSVLS